MSEGITNTPFSMNFCLYVSSTTSRGAAITGPNQVCGNNGINYVGYDNIRAVPLPTYASPPTSEAFLGNNGFYTGVPGNPTLYTCQLGSTSIITLTNITVLDANGIPATNWELVTGDAESTDSGESITWTTCPTTGSCASEPVLNVIPNSPTSEIGNTCATAYGNNAGFTGGSTQTVGCSSSVSSDKTGTVMLESLAPSTLTVHLVGGAVGNGLQAMFLGVLLP